MESRMNPKLSYIFTNAALCRRCSLEIYWFTTPTGKKMPFDASKIDEALLDVGIPKGCLARNWSCEAELAKRLLLPHNHFATCEKRRVR